MANLLYDWNAAPMDWSDDQLADAIRRQAGRTEQSYNALVAELNRRAADRQAKASHTLAVVVGVATIVNALVAVVAALTP